MSVTGTTLITISATSDPSSNNKSVTFLLPDLSAKLVNLSDAFLSSQDTWSAQVILAAQLDSDYVSICPLHLRPDYVSICQLHLKPNYASICPLHLRPER